jgi:hypothetical protein
LPAWDTRKRCWGCAGGAYDFQAAADAPQKQQASSKGIEVRGAFHEDNFPVAGAGGNPLYAARAYTISSSKGGTDDLAHKIPKKGTRSSWVPASGNPIKANFAELPVAKLQGPLSVDGSIGFLLIVLNML